MFISFEGTEGAGKSTLIAHVQQSLLQQGQSVVLTREPGGTPLAEKMRELLLAPSDEKWANRAELLLLYAARAQHIEQKILPALAQNQIVLCDRFIDASMAYQHGGRGLPAELIQVLNQHFVACVPDLTFWLDVPVELGMQRAKKRAELDRFEQEDIDFFQRIRVCYAKQALAEPQRIVRLDAEQSIAQLAEQVLQIIQDRIQ